MKRVLVILAVLALSAPAWGITGKVVDNKGRPVAKAKVDVWIFWMTDKTYHADNKGEFVYSKLVLLDGTVQISSYKIVDAAGKPVPKAAVTLRWGGGEEPTTFYTNQKGEFTYQVPGDSKGVMRVLTGSGAPVPRAKAIQTSFAGKSETVMDDKGELRYERNKTVPRSKKELLAHVLADGYTYASAYFHLEPAKPLVIRVWPDRVVRARVVDQNGVPLQGVKVVPSNATAEMKAGAGSFSYLSESKPGGIVTRKDGSFELHHLPGEDIAKSASVNLTVDAPGRAKIERTYPLAGLRKSGKITLPRECVLQGTLRPPTGKTIPDDTLLDMKLREDGYSGSPSQRYAGVDKDGKFRFDKLPPGEATIVLSTTHRRTIGWTLPAVQDLPIASGEVKNLDMTGAVGGVISGVVRDKATGNPIASAALTYEDAGNPGGNWWLTEDDGTYSIRVAPGQVKVYVSFIWANHKRINFDPKYGVSLEVTDGQDKSGVDLSIDPSVEGKVDTEPEVLR